MIEGVSPNPRCPMRYVLVGSVKPGELVGSIKRCDAELYLEWVMTVPFPHTPGASWSRAHVATSAASDSWRVVCTEGHVLAVSGTREANDYAEPFDPAAVLRAIQETGQ